ncbi:transcription antiterminator BglG [Anaerobacillus alkalilacustris]|uniref:Ascorbate-specific PTS system EIIA component n=1 Tax=Anaerobacillus alkalilacustris TaxID=393763 RepID=A0A1S2LK59_9BACI|nr:BglG family transcription antiterminator [Anaerobacillus alkalilacustris]OIJ12580.1 transcription antiterminator BglG [Anaerobacillus alkalilacustris]
MHLDDRSNYLLKEVITNPGVKNKDLEVKFNLSRRQIGYSFVKINDWLQSNNFPPIERSKNGTFIINPTLITLLQVEKKPARSDEYILSDKDRVYMIYLMLLSRNEELSLLHFTSTLEVSKNTILSDIKNAQTQLAPYKLLIQYSRQTGYSIEGSEFQKRKLLIFVIDRILEMYNGESRLQQIANIKEADISDLQERIEKIESKLNLKFTCEKVRSMPYEILLIVRRIKLGKYISSLKVQYDELSDTKEFIAAEELLYDIEHIPSQERLYITLHLLTTNIASSEMLTEETIPELIAALREMLSLFEKYACIEIENRDHLGDKILLHLKPAYYRIKYKLTVSNYLVETINKEYKELHHLVKKSSLPLQKLIGCEIPDSEAAYLTMLIGGWLKRQGENLERKVKALVVCPNGVSVSKLIDSTLRELFPEFLFLDSLSVREFQNFKLDYDVVFSPVFLQTKKKLYVVKSFLERDDKDRLRKQVMLELYGYVPSEMNVEKILEIIERHAKINDKHSLSKELNQYLHRDNEINEKKKIGNHKPHLADLITGEKIILKKSIESWEDAIRVSSEPLVLNGSVTEGYVDAMIERYDQNDPYIIIGHNLAIPHATPEDGVNEVSMSLLRLEEGVQFSKEHNVHVVVTIAALDKEQHLRALTQLMKLSGNKEAINSIIQAKNEKEIYQILKKYSID